jgi:hypothetical protein
LTVKRNFRAERYCLSFPRGVPQLAPPEICIDLRIFGEKRLADISQVYAIELFIEQFGEDKVFW